MGLESRTDYLNPSSSVYSQSKSLSLKQPDTYSGEIESDAVSSPTHLDALTEGIRSEKTRDPIHYFLADKKAFLSKSVEDILGMIYEREYLRDTNCYRIDRDSCYISQKLYEIYYIPLGLNPNIDKLRSNLEREMIAFEREKRMESVACWRDITRLKSDLREVMREFSQENRKGYLLSGDR